MIDKFGFAFFSTTQVISRIITQSWGEYRDRMEDVPNSGEGEVDACCFDQVGAFNATLM